VVQRSPIGLQSHPKDRRGSRETSSHGVAREYARFPLLRHPLVAPVSMRLIVAVVMPARLASSPCVNNRRWRAPRNPESSIAAAFDFHALRTCKLCANYNTKSSRTPLDCYLRHLVSDVMSVADRVLTASLEAAGRVQELPPTYVVSYWHDIEAEVKTASGIGLNDGVLDQQAVPCWSWGRRIGQPH